jgi:hypothetical protein
VIGHHVGVSGAAHHDAPLPRLKRLHHYIGAIQVAVLHQRKHHGTVADQLWRSRDAF